MLMFVILVGSLCVSRVIWFCVGGVVNNCVCIFFGIVNFELSEEIVNVFGFWFGVCKVSYFVDGEMFVEIKENVRGVDVYVIQLMSKLVN